MIYKNFHDIKLSALGMGCMRLPVVENSTNDGEIDEIKTAEIIELAFKNGINYFDTAWGYHNGESENIVGKIINNTKIPNATHKL
jgi:predicted aldo/keto reductase-like oxidoreductase